MGVLWIAVAVLCLAGGVVLLWIDRRRRAVPVNDRSAAWPSAAARTATGRGPAVRDQPPAGVTGPPSEREAGELFTDTPPRDGR